MNLINFVVFGKPVGKQRPRTVKNKFTGKTVTYTPNKTKDYEAKIARAYKDVFAKQGKNTFAFNGAVEMNIRIYVKEPLEKRTVLPINKPDIDNIVKTILDGLNGVAYRDDAQVVTLFVYKEYAAYDFVSVDIKSAEE